MEPLTTTKIVSVFLCRQLKETVYIAINNRLKESAYQGFIDTPGGKVEEGEYWEQAMVREFKEETGLNWEETDFIDLGDPVLCIGPAPTFSRVLCQWYVALYGPLFVNQELRNTEPDKKTDWRWISVRDFPYLKPILMATALPGYAELLKFLKNKE